MSRSLMLRHAKGSSTHRHSTAQAEFKIPRVNDTGLSERVHNFFLLTPLSFALSKIAGTQAHQRI